jgi:cystathionine gamma-synthase
MALQEPTVVFIETPSNPMAHIVDISGIGKRLKQLNAILVVDSTLGTPVNQQPLRLGADLVVHSASKYLSGHYNVIAGSITGRSALIEKLHHFRTMSGLCLDPHSAWLLLQGLQTLELRVREQNHTAQVVAEHLAAHADVQFVSYPGLKSSPSYDIAVKQMSGFGGVLSFGLRFTDAQTRFFLESLELCTLAVSLGGTKTLIESPALMSHAQGGPDHESLAFVPANTVRLSVGLEGAEDIIRDLTNGITKAKRAA